ncbi:hypothetical protein P3X46_020778 [Hevea brasiliensis]|uniref:Uncharacterized protein n=2 Tax=Hevea brasiliensis TaxID=3981 RepID=A0ABQ9LH87_HEVBR|nr:hypothetical protein P3X46_020778 [Hevea brasiliensis]
MEQRSSPHYQPRYTRNDEIEVSAILLKLPSLIVESECGLQLPLSWGSKRRRSAYETQRLVHLPSTPVRSLHGMGGLLVSVIDPEKTTFKVQASSSSPATPLAFPPSESDEKPKRLKGTASVKKTKEECLKIIKQYTRINELLIKEIEQTRLKYEELKANNLWLQAKRQELSLGSIRREKPQWELKASKNSLNFMLKRRQPIVKASSTVVGYEDDHHHRPSIMDTTANKAGIAESYQYSNGQTQSLASRTGSTISEDVGPRGVPDLNVSSWESLRMDFANPADEK